jgi:hypothetical protein
LVLAFEVAAGSVTLGFAHLDPALAFAGILASTAGGGGSAGTGAFTAVAADTFAGGTSVGDTHWSDGEHSGGGSGQSNTSDFLCSIHFSLSSLNLGNDDMVGTTYTDLEKGDFGKFTRGVKKN